LSLSKGEIKLDSIYKMAHFNNRITVNKNYIYVKVKSVIRDSVSLILLEDYSYTIGDYHNTIKNGNEWRCNIHRLEKLNEDELDKAMVKLL